jgi:hypothetical protein
MKELMNFQNRYKVIDETEAYLRHRARVHEREKREKLKKQGKLDAYLAEVERNKPKPELKVEEKLTKKETVALDNFMQEYLESRKFDKENQAVHRPIVLQVPVEETSVAKVTATNGDAKRKVKKRKKSKKQKIAVEDDVVLNEAEFRPQMAGSTGLPSFFFSNLVKQNRTALQEAQARHRMTPLKNKKKSH